MHAPSLPLLLIFVCGAVVSLQAFLNGRLADNLGSAELACCVNNLSGLAALVAVSVVTGVPPRAWRSLAAPSRLRWWHPTAGVNGAFFITVAAYAAPRVGVALLTVALVCGQTTGSLLADRAGLSPAGRKLLTPFRVLGVGLALAAVGLAAIGSAGEPRIGLLALAVLAGAGVAVQWAALGHVAKATGEPLAASAINFAAGAVAIVIVALVVTGGSAPGGWSAPPGEWIGGMLGACVAVLMATVARTVGVLQMMLALVAGQSAGGLLLDLVAPPPGEAVTVLTVVGVALTVAAVLVSGIKRRPSRRRAAVE